MKVQVQVGVRCVCGTVVCRHGVIVSSLLHPRQKLGAGSVREAGGTRAGEAIEPMT